MNAITPYDLTQHKIRANTPSTLDNHATARNGAVSKCKVLVDRLYCGTQLRMNALNEDYAFLGDESIRNHL